MDENEKETIDIGALFQFDQFKKLIQHLLTTQKNLTNKIKEIESKMTSNNKITHESFNFVQMEINEFTGRQDVIPYLIHETTTDKDDAKDKTDRNVEQTDLDAEVDKTRHRSSSIIANSSLFPTSSGFDMKHINIVIKMINSRLKANETKLSELSKVSQREAIALKHQSLLSNSSNDKQGGFDLETRLLIDKKLSELEETVLDLKEKTRTFDVFDILENVKDGDGNQIEMSKVLIKALEKKIFTKFGIVDEKIKQLTEDTIKLKSSHMLAANTEGRGSKSNQFKSSEDFDEVMAFYSKSIEDINDKLQLQPKEIKTELNLSLAEIEDKMVKELNEKEALIINHVRALLSNGTASDGKKLNISSDEMFNIENDTKALINKSIEESEKYLKSQIAALNIDNIKKDIQTLLKALLGKIERKDLQDLYHKIDGLHDSAMESKKQYETNKVDIDIMNQVIERITKKLEFINGIVFAQKQQNTQTNNNKEPIVDISKYVTQNQLSQTTSSFLVEIDKLVKETESLRRNVSKIEGQMKTMATESDLKNLEQCIMNEFDEYKIKSLKKFSDKQETNKSLKYLDVQMRHYFDISNNGTGVTNKKDTAKGGDWLIAKKPVGLFHCASCDSYIGELNNTVKYSAWNKIPTRDDMSKYRMGHGFSKMLQMVNMDLLKSAELVKDSISEGEQTKDDNREKSPSFTHVESQPNTQDVNIQCNSDSNSNPIKKKLPKIVFTSHENNNSNQEDETAESPKRLKGPRLYILSLFMFFSMKIFRKTKAESNTFNQSKQ